ncbi:hypothetical protein BZARG_03215 [Bizionia argentinensis JUB59]|uniref:Uncharacterized protein n=1 Tax=Bizionia argentinensis JUB59 TaxID=1046627 RepID=A0A4U8UGT3_9FLAO|nr:hypothetical protein BZARG_03215 [Bizionia argentinensis JUB59]
MGHKWKTLDIFRFIDKHRTPNTEHRTPNTEHRTPNTEHRTPPAHPERFAEAGTPSLCKTLINRTMKTIYTFSFLLK